MKNTLFKSHHSQVMPRKARNTKRESHIQHEKAKRERKWAEVLAFKVATPRETLTKIAARFSVSHRELKRKLARYRQAAATGDPQLM